MRMIATEGWRRTRKAYNESVSIAMEKTDTRRRKENKIKCVLMEEKAFDDKSNEE